MTYGKMAQCTCNGVVHARSMYADDAVRHVLAL